MKRLIYISIVLFFTALACTKEEIPVYDLGKDGIQFEYGDGEFSQQFDFSFQSYQGQDDWGYPMTKYYGDSIREKKIQLLVSIVGWSSEKERKFKVKAEGGDGYDPTLVALDEFYTIRAGRYTDTIEITLLRPSQRGRYKVKLSFDAESPGTDFEFGAEEKLEYTFDIVDSYPKPSDWDGRIAWLGEYSEEKYAFIVTVTNMKYGYYVDWGMYNQLLRDELDRYNSENPTNPKDFSFPVNTDSIWWY